MGETPGDVTRRRPLGTDSTSLSSTSGTTSSSGTVGSGGRPEWMQARWPSEVAARASQASQSETAGGDVTNEADEADAPAAAPLPEADEVDEGQTAREEELRESIAETRAEMSQTIDAIQQRLAPSQLMEQAKETVTDAAQHAVQEAKEAVREATVGRVEDAVSDVAETARDVSTGIMDTIRQNPLPATIAAVGIGWLFMRGRAASRRVEYRPARVRYTESPSQERPSGTPYRGATYVPRSSTRSFGGTRAVGPTYGRSGTSVTYERGGYAPVGTGGVASGQQDTGGRGVTERVGEAVGQARDTVGEAVGQARDTVGEAVGQARDTVGEAVGQAKDTVGETVDQVRETAGEMAGEMQDQVEHLGDQVSYQAERIQNEVQRLVYRYPLAAGIAALGLGAVVGLVVPGTRREDELLGEARDQLMGRAGETIQEVGQQAQDATRRLEEEMQQGSPAAAGGR